MQKSCGERTATGPGGEKFWYCVKDGGCAAVLRCEARSERVSIPECLGGCEVRELAEGACCNLSCVREVVCPKSLRCIGKRAFAGCANLRGVRLNEGLESIGDEAFSSCRSLAEVVLPVSLKQLGAGLSGSGVQSVRWGCTRTEVFISPDSEHLFADEHGVVYQRADEGLILVDGSRFAGKVLEVDARAVEIGPHALQNTQVERVVLPEGLTRIGEGAFRGCTRLVEVAIPETLEEIGTAAFSRTAIRSIYLPCRCVHVHAEALCTGPVFPGSAKQAYYSSLREIRVHPDNPRFTMRGPVLCQRIGWNACAECAGYAERMGESADEDDRSIAGEQVGDAGKQVGAGGFAPVGATTLAAPFASDRLEAVLCPEAVGEVDLSCDVVHVAAPAFAGTSRIGMLRLREDVAFAFEGLLPHNRCERLVIELARPRRGFEAVDVEIPAGGLGVKLLESSLKGGRVDVERLLVGYDEAVLRVEDAYDRAYLALARLAAPCCLDASDASVFRAFAEEEFLPMCVAFGMKNQWVGFDRLMEAGLLNEGNIPDIVGKLTSAGLALAAGYLLEAKRQRFGEACWDYGI